ncbi:MAG: ABC transporter substrate-binding protein [Magnetovibrio sp.]|nr:ABC transporter substrate-binding protein [Magnetovibrio sp.]
MLSNFIKSMLLIVFLTVTLGACSEEPQPPMHVGTNVWPGYEPAYLAKILGYYSEKDIRLSQFQSATESIRAFRNGAIDVVALTLDETLLLIQDGIDVQVFLVADISDGGDVIIANPKFKKMKDLKGHKIGVESSALGGYVLARALEINGMQFEDIEQVYLTIDESEQAYLAGDVDAVVTFEPYRSRLLREGANEVFSSREMPNEIVDVLVVRKAYAVKNYKKLALLSSGWFKAVDLIKNQPERAAKLIGKRLSLSPEEVTSSFEGIILPNAEMSASLLMKNTPISLIEGALKLERVLGELGLLKAHVPLNDVFTNAYSQ